MLFGREATLVLPHEINLCFISTHNLGGKVLKGNFVR